jgi:imidazolonepropionase-like amidohydrolase
MWDSRRLERNATARSATAVAVAIITCVIAVVGNGRSTWVYPGDDGRLRYKTDARGNRIMDFSHAGYKGGGVQLPDVPVARTLEPASGDSTARIQAAIDEVSRRLPDSVGIRGAVLLQKGTYDVAAPLRIGASGVVLRGSGSREDGTIIRVGGPPHRVFDVGGEGTSQPQGKAAAIADAYVPSGADSFTVDSASGFRAGDNVLIQRPVTEAWIRFMGMDTLVRNGTPQTWIKPGTLISHDRTIKSVSGTRITLDVPLSDSFDATYLNPPGTTVVKYSFPGRIEHAGLESLRVVAPAQDKPINESQYTLLRMNAVSDSWVRDIVSVDTHNSITFGQSVRRVTVEDVHIRHTMPFTAPAAPADFAISGTQILLDRCSVTGQGVWPVVTQAGVTGPNVVLDFKADGAGIAPHQRWATGLLVDRSEFTGGTERRPNIAFSNREHAGSGHGWSVGWAVAWNVKADYLLIQQPPGAKNWCIGCTGKPTPILWHGNPIPLPEIPSETFEAPGATVSPDSLYVAQLRDRRTAARPTAIVGARLIDGSGAKPLDGSVVVVEGDRIREVGPRSRVRIPRDARVMDATGKVLMPGLVDAHCHINQEPADMKRYWVAQLRWGVTTMRSAGNDKPDRVPLFRQTRDGRIPGPRAYTAGQGFSVSGPYPGAPTFKPTTAEEARANVQSLKAQRVDFLKIWMTNPRFPPRVISAIVDEAKKQDIPVVAHVTDVPTLRELADQGVTDFLHTPRDEPVSPELVAYAKERKLSFAPTLANGEASWFYYEHPEILNMPMLQDALYPRGRQMLADAERKQKILSSADLAQRKSRLREAYPFIKTMSDAGVRIVTGTDCGAEASQVTPFGHATHREMQMYAEAGMSPLAAIRAATLDAARVLTRSEDPDYGVVRAGKAADLLLLDADPTVDINNSIKINRVMRAGQWVQ